MTAIKEMLEKIASALRDISESPRLDAELMISLILKKERDYLYAHPEKKLTFWTQHQLAKLIKRRQKGEPIAYLLGHKEFWTLDLMVNRHVLIPRPETELIVEWVLQQFPANETITLADLGVGSGAIALALASERKDWVIDAIDCSSAALNVAKKNAKKYAIQNVFFYKGNWCAALPRKNYHAILGNPPYIAAEDPHLSRLGFEPLEALVSGKDGLSAIRKIISQAMNYLQKGGFLVLEHGEAQRDAIIQLMQSANYKIITDQVDLAGLPRMIVGEKT